MSSIHRTSETATADEQEHAHDRDRQQDRERECCPECAGALEATRSETVCEDCGLVVVDQTLDHGPEWRALDADERKRTGAPLTTTRHDRGLSTEIGWDGDAHGNRLSDRQRTRLARLRREHIRSRQHSNGGQSLAHGLGEVRRVVSALDLSESLCEQACTLFRSAKSEDLLVGHSLEAMAAASAYAVCRCNSLPCQLDEVAPRARCERIALRSAYNKLNTELGLPAVPMQPQDYVGQFTSELGVPERIRRRAREYAEQAADAGLTSGRQPTGMAAACVYQAALDHSWRLTQPEVAEIAKVSPPTIRAHRKALTGLLRNDQQE